MKTLFSKNLSIAVFFLLVHAVYPSDSFDSPQPRESAAFAAVITKHPNDDVVIDGYETHRLYGTIPEIITNSPSLLQDGALKEGSIHCIHSNELCVVFTPEAAQEKLDGVSIRIDGRVRRWDAFRGFLEVMPRTPNLHLFQMSNVYLVVASSEQECSTLVLLEGACPSNLPLEEVKIKVSDPDGTYRLRESRLSKTGDSSYSCLLQIDYYGNGIKLEGTRYLNSKSLGQTPLTVTFLHNDKVLAKRNLDNLLHTPTFSLDLADPLSSPSAPATLSP